MYPGGQGSPPPKHNQSSHCGFWEPADSLCVLHPALWVVKLGVWDPKNGVSVHEANSEPG